ncbi:hypothetical protein QQF64_029767 [Cirrhinus molitorella]|uniref:Uncharacterized protein n=1 Tax=Cirrhinus molitorella TaxID=172907 RepID=A0ABR3N1R1_9TELE
MNFEIPAALQTYPIGLERRPKGDRRPEGNPVSIYLTRSYNGCPPTWYLLSRGVSRLAPDENALASASLSPLAPLRTHGTLTAASGCVDSQQLRFVYASWDAWHCHFINYLWLLLGAERAMNYLVLQLQT